jgi:DNA-binding response OmpR family regulator
MDAITVEKVMDMDLADGSYSREQDSVGGSKGSFLEKALIDALTPLLERSDSETERVEFRPDDYHIALITRQKFSHFQKRILQRVTADVWLLPVTLSELVDRLQTNLNRSASTDRGTTFQFGEIHVDFRQMKVTRCRRVVALKPLEFKLLKFFTQNSERVISRHELLDKVWGYNHYPTTRTVDNHVYSLRRKLEPNQVCPTHFVTVHGMGYRFVP